MYDEDGVRELQEQFDAACEDVEGDNPEVECGFEMDLAVGVALTSEADEETRCEFFRREFGYVPNEYRRLRP